MVYVLTVEAFHLPREVYCEDVVEVVVSGAIKNGIFSLISVLV